MWSFALKMKFLLWIKKLRHPKTISCGGGEITAEEWRSAATLMRRRGSNPAAPPPGSKPEPPAGPPSTCLDGVLDPTPPQAQILAVCNGMKLRADAEKAAAAQLREIAESLVGVVAAEQGSIPATTDSGQILVTPPKPQPTGSETLLEMVRYAIAEEPWEDEAKGAVLAVARWLHAQDCGHTARLLEREGSE